VCQFAFSYNWGLSRLTDNGGCNVTSVRCAKLPTILRKKEIKPTVIEVKSLNPHRFACFPKAAESGWPRGVVDMEVFFRRQYG